MKIYLILETIEKPNKDGKASILFYDNKWKEDYINLQYAKNITGKRVRKFGFECIQYNDLNRRG
jgi:hypothetical protein